MEARIFFPFTQLSDNDDSSSATAATTPTLANLQFVKLIRDGFPALFGAPRKETPEQAAASAKAVATRLAGDAPEHREDLYLVLAPHGGNLLGIKWRGKATDAAAAAKLDDAARAKLLDGLLDRPVEIKVTPFVAPEEFASKTVPAAQLWSKLKVSSLRSGQQPPHVQSATKATTSAAAAAQHQNEQRSPIHSFLGEVAYSLQKLASTSASTSESQKASLTFAAQEISNRLKTSSNVASAVKFVAVDKSRRDVSLRSAADLSWNLEETDVVVEDVTHIFCGDKQQVNTKRKFRSWCLEPTSLLRGPKADAVSAMSDEFARICAAVVLPSSQVVASYPAFLCGLFDW